MPRKTIKKPAPRAAVKKYAPIAKPAAATPVAAPGTAHKRSSTVYVYWIIILFFVCATFYILGRGHDVLTKRSPHEVVMSVRGTELLASGKNKLLSGDIPGAIADMSAAVESDPDVALVYNYRGEAYMSAADYASAELDLNRAIALDPENSLALYDRALLNIQLDNLDAAMADLDHALYAFDKRPNTILSARVIYSKRAQLHLWLKNWDAAISDYSASLDLSSSDPSDEDFAGRADAYTAVGNYDAALKDYMSAITTISNTIKDNEDAAIRINMSRRAMSYFEKSAALHVQQGNMEAAKAELEAANTLAVALNDEDTQKRIKELLANLPPAENSQQQNADG